MMSDLHPTHTAFDDALDLLMEAIKANPGSAESDELKLVHAVCVAPDGEEYSHAWIETHGTHVWFVAIAGGNRVQLRAEIKEFYAELNVRETTKYTPQEAVAENIRWKTYGPWLERYQTRAP